MIPLNQAVSSDRIPSGRVDIALAIPRFVPQNWFTRRLYEERYYCAIRADHPIAAKKIDLDAFCSCEHLLVSPYKNNFAGVMDVALARVGRTRKIGLVIPSSSDIGAILEQTDLIAVLPERTVRTVKRRLYTFPPPLDIGNVDVVAAWPERVHEDPLHAWFRQLCYDSTQLALSDG